MDPYDQRTTLSINKSQSLHSEMLGKNFNRRDSEFFWMVPEFCQKQSNDSLCDEHSGPGMRGDYPGDQLTGPGLHQNGFSPERGDLSGLGHPQRGEDTAGPGPLTMKTARHDPVNAVLMPSRKAALSQTTSDNDDDDSLGETAKSPAIQCMKSVRWHLVNFRAKSCDDLPQSQGCRPFDEPSAPLQSHSQPRPRLRSALISRKGGEIWGNFTNAASSVAEISPNQYQDYFDDDARSNDDIQEMVQALFAQSLEPLLTLQAFADWCSQRLGRDLDYRVHGYAAVMNFVLCSPLLSLTWSYARDMVISDLLSADLRRSSMANSSYPFYGRHAPPSFQTILERQDTLSSMYTDVFPNAGSRLAVSATASMLSSNFDPNHLDATRQETSSRFNPLVELNIGQRTLSFESSVLDLFVALIAHWIVHVQSLLGAQDSPPFLRHSVGIPTSFHGNDIQLSSVGMPIFVLLDTWALHFEPKLPLVSVLCALQLNQLMQLLGRIPAIFIHQVSAPVRQIVPDIYAGICSPQEYGFRIFLYQHSQIPVIPDLVPTLNPELFSPHFRKPSQLAILFPTSHWNLTPAPLWSAPPPSRANHPVASIYDRGLLESSVSEPPAHLLPQLAKAQRADKSIGRFVIASPVPVTSSSTKESGLEGQLFHPRSVYNPYDAKQLDFRTHGGEGAPGLPQFGEEVPTPTAAFLEHDTQQTCSWPRPLVDIPMQTGAQGALARNQTPVAKAAVEGPRSAANRSFTDSFSGSEGLCSLSSNFVPNQDKEKNALQSFLLDYASRNPPSVSNFPQRLSSPFAAGNSGASQRHLPMGASPSRATFSLAPGPDRRPKSTLSLHELSRMLFELIAVNCEWQVRRWEEGDDFLELCDELMTKQSASVESSLDFKSPQKTGPSRRSARDERRRRSRLMLEWIKYHNMRCAVEAKNEVATSSPHAEKDLLEDAPHPYQSLDLRYLDDFITECRAKVSPSESAQSHFAEAESVLRESVQKFIDLVRMKNIHKERLHYRHRCIGVFVSALKSEWSRYYRECYPLGYLLNQLQFRKVKDVLLDTPNIILTGDGGFMRVVSREHFMNNFNSGRGPRKWNRPGMKSPQDKPTGLFQCSTYLTVVNKAMVQANPRKLDFLKVVQAANEMYLSPAAKITVAPSDALNRHQLLPVNHNYINVPTETIRKMLQRLLHVNIWGLDLFEHCICIKLILISLVRTHCVRQWRGYGAEHQGEKARIGSRSDDSGDGHDMDKKDDLGRKQINGVYPDDYQKSLNALPNEHRQIISRCNDLKIRGLQLIEVCARWNSTFPCFSPMVLFMKRAGIDDLNSAKFHDFIRDCVTFELILLESSQSPELSYLYPTSLKFLEQDHH